MKLVTPYVFGLRLHVTAQQGSFTIFQSDRGHINAATAMLCQ